MKENGKPRKILVLLYLSYCSGREILYGISRYARLHCRWQFHIVDLASAAALDELRRTGEEGILKQRFGELKRQLRDTDMPIEKIIAACGFRTLSNAKTLFRKRFDCSMRAYRQKCRQKPKLK